MTQIEWSEPMPCFYGSSRLKGIEMMGIVNGKARFTLQALLDRSAKLWDRGEFVSLTAGEEMGESHVDHLIHVAAAILEFERASA